MQEDYKKMFGVLTLCVQSQSKIIEQQSKLLEQQAKILERYGDRLDTLERENEGVIRSKKEVKSKQDIPSKSKERDENENVAPRHETVSKRKEPSVPTWTINDLVRRTWKFEYDS
jgi:ATP phosphoribosyltransferase